MNKRKVFGIIVFMLTMIAASVMALNSQDVADNAERLRSWANGRLQSARSSKNYETLQSCRNAIEREMVNMDRLRVQLYSEGKSFTDSQQSKYNNAFNQMASYIYELDTLMDRMKQ